MDQQTDNSASLPVLAQADASAIVDAPLDSIDLSKWVFQLSDEEYRDCAPGEHKGCGASVLADGRPVSICVEMVGGQLMVQHYVPEIMTPTYCRMTSMTDVFAAPYWTKVHVIWEIRVVATDDGKSLFKNSIISRATPEFLSALEAAKISVAEAAAQRTDGVDTHNRRETPAFAASVAHHARRAGAPQQ